MRAIPLEQFRAACETLKNYKHINFENGSHNLGCFPINNNLLPQEKKHPAECQKAREDALELILQTLGNWGVEQL